MLIKNSSIYFQSPSKLPAIYFLLGQEPLQLNNISQTIKSTWRQYANDEAEIQVIQVSSANDWAHVQHEATSYSLFSNRMLIDSYYDKKTLDAAGKNFFDNYLKQINPECLLLFQAPNLTLKSLQFLVSNPDVHVILSSQPSSATIQQWIQQRLTRITNEYDQQIPTLIHRYNEGNLLACAQILDKLNLIIEPGEALTLDVVKDQLVDQSSFPLFELGIACLLGDGVKALKLLQQAQGNKTEPSLILWLLTQEIRLLMQLIPFANQGQLFRDTANHLKIWSQRITIYQSAIKKYNEHLLIDLFHYCNQLDIQIKTSQNKHIWQSFELIALALCTGKKVMNCV